MFAFSKSGGNLFESGFNLGECDTGLKVLDNLGGLINIFDLLLVFSILLLPGCVLLFSELFLWGEGLLVHFDVLGGNSDFFLGFSEGVGGILLELGGGDDSGLVIGDFLFHVVNELFTWGDVVILDWIGSLLVGVDVGGDIVQQQVDLVDGGTGGKVELNNRQDWVTQSVLVDLGQGLLGVHNLLIGGNQSNKHSQCNDSFHFFYF